MSQIEILRQSKEPEEDKRPFKILVLSFLCVLLSVGSFYFFTQFITGFERNDFLAFFFSAILFLISAAFLALFIKSRKLLGLIAAAVGLAPLIVVFGKYLYPKPAYLVLAGGLIFAALVVSGVFRGHRHAENGLKPRFMDFTRQVIPRVALGFLIFLSIVLYFGYFELGLLDEESGGRVFSSAVTHSEPVLNLWLGKVSFEQPVGEFFNNLALAHLMSPPPELRQMIIDEFGLPFRELDPPLQARIAGEIAANLKASAEETFGDLDDEVIMKDALYAALLDYLGGLSDGLKKFLAVTFAVSAFLVFKGVVFVLYWPIELIAFLIFKLMIMLNFAHVSVESTSREFVALS